MGFLETFVNWTAEAIGSVPKPILMAITGIIGLGSVYSSYEVVAQGGSPFDFVTNLISFFSAVGQYLIVFLSTLVELGKVVILYISLLLGMFPALLSWVTYFITNFWLIFAVIEMGIFGLCFQEQGIINKLSRLIQLHATVYLRIYYLFIDIIRLFIRLIGAIGSYIPFT